MISSCGVSSCVFLSSCSFEYISSIIGLSSDNLESVCSMYTVQRWSSCAEKFSDS